MTAVLDIYQKLCELAPLELQMDFDNSGFQLGHLDQGVTHVLLALDVTDRVIEEAVRLGAQLIVSHHPLIFHPVRAMTDASPEGRRLLRLAEQGIAVISMHTNLDIAANGVNDVLMERLGVRTESVLDEDGCGRIGYLDAKMTLQEFLPRCRAALGCEGLRYADARRPVYRVAVMGGSGSSAIDRAAALGCDTYVTADVKYHQFQHAADLGINLIDADHFYSENPVMEILADRLGTAFPALKVSLSADHHAIVHFA